MGRRIELVDASNDILCIETDFDQGVALVTVRNVGVYEMESRSFYLSKKHVPEVLSILLDWIIQSKKSKKRKRK